MSAMMVEERVDLEEALSNEMLHFRTTHFSCKSKILPGMILESNCGALYRTKGKSDIFGRCWRCDTCVAKSEKKSCPVCHRSV